MISVATFAVGVVIVITSVVTITSMNLGSTSSEFLPAISAIDSKATNSNSRIQPIAKQGQYLGKLHIPRLRKTIAFYEGTDKATLKKGAGHYMKSVMPGVRDNSVIAGHRDSVFKNFGSLKRGDLLIISTARNTFTYKISSFRVVDKEDRTVIVPTIKATLTLSTCFPFTYIGNAPDRFIVTAHLQ